MADSLDEQPATQTCASDKSAGETKENSNAAKTETDDTPSVTASFTDLPSGDRLIDCQKEVGRTSASPDLVQSSAVSTSVLHELLNSLRDASSTIRTLQEYTKEGLSEFKNFARNMTRETNLTNELLSTLIKETRAHGDGLDCYKGEAVGVNSKSFPFTPAHGDTENHYHLNISEKQNETIILQQVVSAGKDRELSTKDSSLDHSRDPRYGTENGITREPPETDRKGGSDSSLEHCRHQELGMKNGITSGSCGPEHKKCDGLCPYLTDPNDRPEKVEDSVEHQKEEESDSDEERERNSDEGRECNSSHAVHRNQAQDRAAGNSTLNNFRQNSSPRSKDAGAVNDARRTSAQIFSLHSSQMTRVKKEKPNPSASEGGGSQNHPGNTESRRPSTGARAKDVRPKESSYSGSSRPKNKTSAQYLTVDGGGEAESQRLHEALARARRPDPNPPPKARSYDTVLCLDISESMRQGGAYQQMMEIVHQFINGVEDMTSEVEENIALVTFGGRANIAQHLTNDFSLVREALRNIELYGSSPFFEAMVVCLGAFDGKGGTVSVSGEYDVHPRIIFITDGHITEGSDEPIDRVFDATNTRARFSRLMMDLNPKKDPSMPHPIVFVPVGSRADMVFLQSVVQLNDGQLMQPQNLKSICNYYKIQEMIGKVIVCLHDKNTEDISDREIRAIIQSLAPNLTEQEISDVVTSVCKEMDNPFRRRSRTDPTTFDDVYEDKEGVAENERLPLGTRVVRGPDWRWSEQDKGGPGTVVQHENKKHGFTWVLWDEGHKNKNRYPYGSEMGYHIWKTDGHPALRSKNGRLQIGMVVKKGPKWNNPNFKYDGEPGVVIRVSRDEKQVKVRWKNGVIHACPVYAVEFSDPLESRGENGRHQTESVHEPEPEPEEEEDDGDKIPVWQWRDDWGNWRLYSKQDRQRVEAAYQRKKNGTCILHHGSGQVRILFQRKVEKDLERHTERDVQRTYLPEHELKSLEVAEELVSHG